MKHLYRILTAILFVPVIALAQITVQENQFKPIFVVGDSINILFFQDSTINVGHKGGPNVYDFSSLTYLSGKGGVAVGSSVPLTSRDFSADTVLSHPGGYEVATFPDSEMISRGKIEISSDTSYKVNVKVPGEVLFSFPLTYGKSWNYSFADYDTSFVNGAPTQETTDASSRTTVVDGYGIVVLPGGDSLQCLRVFQNNATPGIASDETFFYVTATGIFVAVNTTSSQPDTGNVSITDAEVYEGKLSTAVRSIQPRASSFALEQNYPNPFNPVTDIGYQISDVSRVRLSVYNILGQEVATLVDGVKEPGRYTVRFDGSRLASGVYFYRLSAGNRVETKKLVLMK